MPQTVNIVMPQSRKGLFLYVRYFDAIACRYTIW